VGLFTLEVKIFPLGVNVTLLVKKKSDQQVLIIYCPSSKPYQKYPE